MDLALVSSGSGATVCSGLTEHGGTDIELNVDVHAHSGYAGGVGQTSLEEVQINAPLKGIDVFGTGDCLFPAWRDELSARLLEDDRGPGLFVLEPEAPVRFMLQTEVIFTAEIAHPTAGSPGRKTVHTVLLFPSFEAVDGAIGLLDRWEVKNTIGRPFIPCSSIAEVADRCYQLRALDDLIEIVPAHVMTPQGVYGASRPISSMADFYGEATDLINVVETGLSADPVILGQIPELDDYGLISNSDAHSCQLHRMGREFTTLDVPRAGYDEIIGAFRSNAMVRTAEFNPTEGRYFLTGHRAGKQGHGDDFCVFSPEHTPSDGRCPICGKPLTIGVLERALTLGKDQGDPRELGYLPPKSKPFIHMVPLIEIIAHARGIKTLTSKKVVADYHTVVDAVQSECRLWSMSESAIASALDEVVPEELIDAINTVRRGEFGFEPAGYDGTYGELRIGHESDFLDIHLIVSDGQRQLALF